MIMHKKPCLELTYILKIMVDFGERGKIIYIKNLQYWFCLLFIFLIVTLLIVS